MPQCPHWNVRQHLTFGYGAYYCIGPLFARLQLHEAVTRTAIRFPEMRLETGMIMPEVAHYGLRAPITLPVLLK